MCGIVGAVANRNVVSTLIEGLARLEYRGYDSAGIASAFMPLLAIFALFVGLGLLFAGGWVFVVAMLLLAAWLIRATHGGVTESNAHPHVSKGEIAVVHNGIIENHDAQRARLQALGYELT